MLPEGYKPVTNEETSLWMVKSPGNVIEGLLVGRFSITNRSGKSRHYYQIRVHTDRGTKAHHTEKNKTVSCPVDSIVNVDESYKIRGLADVCDMAPQSVYIEYLEKVEIAGGQSMWKIASGHRDATSDEVTSDDDLLSETPH